MANQYTKNPKSMDDYRKKYKTEIEKITNNEYTVLDVRVVETRTNKRKDILVKHKTCGKEYWIQPYHFIKSGYRCTKCSKTRPDYDIFSLKEKVKTLTNNEYECISDAYINCHTKVIFRHNTCRTYI